MSVKQICRQLHVLALITDLDLRRVARDQQHKAYKEAGGQNDRQSTMLAHQDRQRTGPGRGGSARPHSVDVRYVHR
jgi:hypothetical protein